MWICYSSFGYSEGQIVIDAMSNFETEALIDVANYIFKTKPDIVLSWVEPKIYWPSILQLDVSWYLKRHAVRLPWVFTLVDNPAMFRYNGMLCTWKQDRWQQI
jgi:hypothetical protein